jgi:AcrR family transcriptional regulator
VEIEISRKASPLPTRAEKTQQRIRKAALTEFAEKGFEGASVRAIARKANVPDALIHYHFGSKEGLWRSIADEVFDDLHARSDAAVAASDVDGLGKVRLRTRNLLYYDLERPEAQAFIAREYRQQSPRLRYIIDTYLGERFTSALVAIEAAQAADELPAGDPRLLYVIITSLAFALVERAGEIEMLMGRSVADPDVAEEFWVLIDRLLFGRHAASEPNNIDKVATSEGLR